MRKITFDPEKDLNTPEKKNWWDKWSRKAEKASREVMDEYNKGGDYKSKIKSSIWSELKAWLLENVFHNKCAYCEGKYIAGSFNDAEHWRPKSKVTVKEEKEKNIDVTDENGIKHPGYFWLAHDWQNLLPSCEKCNSGKGKMNQFPIDGEYVFKPGTGIDELDRRERPLLLNPYGNDDPSDHLLFASQGIVVPQKGSLKGKESISVYNLGRSELEEDRAERQKEAEKIFSNALYNLSQFDIAIEVTMSDFIGLEARYSIAVRTYIASMRDDFIKKLLGMDG